MHFPQFPFWLIFAGKQFHGASDFVEVFCDKKCLGASENIVTASAELTRCAQ